MADMITKFRCLLLLSLDALSGAFSTWREDIWRHHLDDPYCCSGRDHYSPCGCMGMTIRDVYAPWSARTQKEEPTND